MNQYEWMNERTNARMCIVEVKVRTLSNPSCDLCTLHISIYHNLSIKPHTYTSIHNYAQNNNNSNSILNPRSAANMTWWFSCALFARRRSSSAAKWTDSLHLPLNSNTCINTLRTHFNANSKLLLIMKSLWPFDSFPCKNSKKLDNVIF